MSISSCASGLFKITPLWWNNFVTGQYEQDFHGNKSFVLLEVEVMSPNKETRRNSDGTITVTTYHDDCVTSKSLARHRVRSAVVSDINSLLRICKIPRIPNTQEHGLHLSWYENGNKHTSCYYFRGKKHGPCESYYRDGTTHISCTYVRGQLQGLLTSYNEFGQFNTELNYGQAGKLHGVCKYYDNSGKLISSVYYHDGNKVRDLEL